MTHHHRTPQEDEAWYRDLITRFTPYVTAIVSGVAHGHLPQADLEEAAADVFFKVWQRRDHIRPDSLKAYVAQTARNTAIDRLRRLGEVPVPFEDDILQVTYPSPLDDAAIAGEQRQIIREALLQTGEPDRTIFIRHYLLGEPLQGLSHALGINLSTIKTKLRRLRHKLSHILTERGYGCEDIK